MAEQVRRIAERVIEGGAASREDGLLLADEREAGFDELLRWAGRIREHYRGRKIYFCAIANARSGACAEDCRFCAQSSRWSTSAPVTGIIGENPARAAARAGAAAGAGAFCLGASGRKTGGAEFEMFLSRLRSVGEEMGASGGRAHASLGLLSQKQFEALKAAGVERYNHNLETSRRFFPEICTTHSFDDRLAAARAVKEAGLELCSGGIFGMGEPWAARVEMALALRELGVDCVPVNFLNPVPGTPLEGRPLLPAREALRIVALYRFLLPRAEIELCGGRELVLGEDQSRIFEAGASGLLVGNYLTTEGRPAEEDRRLVESLGLVVAGDDTR